MNDHVTPLEQSANDDFEQQLRDYGLDTAKAMASLVAHDFNNLIAVVRGYASVLQLRPGLDNDSKQLVDCIDQAGAELQI